MKTRYAIDNGRGGAFDDLHLEYVAEPKDHWLMIGLDVAYERPSYVDTLEHYPELDIDKLRLPSMAEQGGVFSRTLQWENEAHPAHKPTSFTIGGSMVCW